MRRIPFPLVPAWLRWLGVLVVGGFVFYTSILASPPSQPVVPGRPTLLPLDKWRHFLAYAAFAGAMAYATADSDRATWQLAVLVVGTTIVYGVGIEAWQSLVPRRYFSLGDAYANALGGLLVVPWYLLQSRLEFRPVFRRLEFRRE